MAKLSPEAKLFIVQRLAIFETPAEIMKAIKAEYDVTVTSQQLQAYDPTKVNGQLLSAKLKGVFEETRKVFLEDTADIPITHKAYRLRVLQRLIQKAEDRGNSPLAAQLLEQAAKEMGGAFTNRRELTGAGGGPIEQEVKMQTLDPKLLSTDTIKALLAARISDQSPANH